MVRVFIGKALSVVLSKQEKEALVADFKRYKETGALPDTFGRDVRYDHPNTLPAVLAEELRHLHLTEDKAWPLGLVQFSRTSDKHLVYCQGYKDSGCYALLAILQPNAHSQSFNRDLMLKLAELARRFRDTH